MNCIKKFWQKYKLNNVFYFVFYMCVCFPFVGKNFIGSDTQPWTLFLTTLIIGVWWFWRKVWYCNIYTNLLLGFLMFCIIIAFLSIPQNQSVTGILRSSANYLSICLIPIATYYVLKTQGGLQEKWLKGVMWVWFGVGFIQSYIDSSFATNLLSHARTHVGRGVMGLAAEPSFYGYMCIFFAIFALNFRRNKFFYIILSAVQILFFAKSTIALLYIIVFGTIYSITWVVQRKPQGFLVILALIIGVIGVYFTIPSIRLIVVNRTTDMIYNLFYRRDVLLMDESVMLRFSSIVDSWKGMLDFWGLPHGFSSVRIMSGYGAMIYETGIVGLGVVFLLFIAMLRGKQGICVALGVTIMLFSAIQLANPLFDFFIGYCIYIASTTHQEVKDVC